MNRIRTLTLTIGLSLLAGGCAIEPRPIPPEQAGQQVRGDLAALFSAQEPIRGPLSLHDAMARAIKYNLDQRVKLMEDALARGKLVSSRYDLLPPLTAAAGYHDRSNESGASSESLLSGQQSLEPSTSQEPQRNTGSAALVWNLLDFGVSYVQAQQQADEVLINQERRRKVIQNIIQDVRYAWWRAVSAETLLPRMEQVQQRLSEALRRVEALERSGIQSPLEYLNYRKQILETDREMWQLRERLDSARAELAALVNVRPGEDFTLALPDAYDIPRLGVELERLEAEALANRPELREEHYQVRISREEVRKAMLRMLPGLELTLAGSYDSNKYLYNNRWAELGLQLSWNLFNILSAPARIDAAEAQVAVDEARLQALGMAVLTQVHLARLRYEVAYRDFEITSQLADVEGKITDFMRNSQAAQLENELQVIRAEADGLLARMNRDLSYAEVQNAYGRLQNSVGLDPLPESLGDDGLEALSQALRERLENWGG
jgi:outer membrane protein, multidrug efflux system